MEGIRGQVLEYIKGHNTMVLATVGSDGPWATPVFYASDGFKLYFLSDPRTRHGQNLKQNSRVAATITEDYRDWRRIQGVQLEGEAQLISLLEVPKALGIYTAKFPFVKDFISEGGIFKIGEKVTGVRFYSITVKRLWFVDNTTTFGERHEVLLR